MTPDDWIGAVEREGSAMTALQSDSLEVQVPTCPEWNIADLLSHTGWVYRYWAFIADLPEGERANRDNMIAAGLPKVGSAQRPNVELFAWFNDSIQTLIDAYGRQPDTKVIDSRFWGMQPLSFIARRMAHETAMHRWDVQHALGDADGFDSVLAADGVDEFLEFWLPLGFRHADFADSTCTIGLDATDSPDRWRVRVSSDSTSWTRAEGEADVIGCGSASDLYLFVWQRLPSTNLLVAGEGETLSQWQSAAAI